MKIGIDCRTILNPDSGEKAGVGRYTQSLVEALINLDRANEYVLFFDYRTKKESANIFAEPNVTIRFLPFSGYGKFLPFGYAHLLVAAAFLKERLDILHGPANIVPLGYTRPFVVTLHDLAIYRHPEWFPDQIFSTRLLVPQVLRRARKIIAVSKATARDAAELFGVPAARLTVISEAASTELLPLRDADHDVRSIYHLPERYFFFTGTIEPRKNLVTLFQAWKKLQTEQPRVMAGVELILAGAPGHESHDILPHIERLQLANSVRHIGYVSHNHKIKLMQGAVGFVFPSWYEGFGLPVLEAMQLGVPVITSAVASLPEITDRAALLIDPGDKDQLAAAIFDVLTQPAVRQRLSRAGPERARHFSWEKAAEETLAVYRQAVG